MGFFSRYGKVVERALKEAQCSPSDIVVDFFDMYEMEEALTELVNKAEVREEITPRVNGTQVPDMNLNPHMNRPPQGGYMPQKQDPFKMQIRHAFPDLFQEENPHEKQRKRSSGQKVRRAARNGEDDRNFRDPNKKEKRAQRKAQRGQCKREQAVNSGHGRSVEMRLEGVVLNGQHQPFERSKDGGER